MRILGLTALAVALLVGGERVDGEEPPVSLFAAEPFVMDLWPDRSPASAVVIDAKNPLPLRAARGQEVAALLVLLAKAAAPRLTLRAEPLVCGEMEIPAERIDLQVVRSVRRDIPGYSRLAAERYPGRYRRGILQPDALVRDEPAFLRGIRDWRRPLPDDSGEAGTAVVAGIGAGSRKYVLVTVSVPDDAPPGDYAGRIQVGEGGVAAPVELRVDPILLQAQQGKVLGIGNEFARDADDLFEPSLTLLSRIGMNATRIAELTSLPDPELTLSLLEESGFPHVIQKRPPRSAAEIVRFAKALDLYFYGLDEPQPKDRERSDFRRMADHVRLSARLHGMGGRVMTSLPFPLALELRDPKSPLYRSLLKVGVKKAHEPLDWANCGLALQRLGGRTGVNAEMFAYIAKLQGEFSKSEWKEEGPALRSKHPWRETYYWPQGLIRDPYYARLLFGFFLFRSHLDGAMAWTLYRTHGLNPHADSREPVATLAYPGETILYSTYCLEAIREGVVDLRYAQQAYRAIARLLRSENKAVLRKGKRLRKKLLEQLEPYRALIVGGKRIDLASKEPERSLRETREALADLILEAGRAP